MSPHSGRQVWGHTERKGQNPGERSAPSGTQGHPTCQLGEGARWAVGSWERSPTKGLRKTRCPCLWVWACSQCPEQAGHSATGATGPKGCGVGVQDRPSPERAVSLNQMVLPPPPDTHSCSSVRLGISGHPCSPISALESWVLENQRQMPRPVTSKKLETGGGRAGSLRLGLEVAEGPQEFRGKDTASGEVRARVQ